MKSERVAAGSSATSVANPDGMSIGSGSDVRADLRALGGAQTVARTMMPTAVSEPVRRHTPTPVPLQISGTDVPDCTCQLVGVDAGFLYVRSDRQIPEASAIVVSFDHVQLSGVVAGCQPAMQEWLISIALASSKRRLDDRIPNGQDGIIGIIGHDGVVLRACRVLDTSAFGMGLLLGFSIDPGSRVCVEAGSTMVFGEVRHCNQKLDGQYIAGLLVVDVVQDARDESKFSAILKSLRWKLASSIRGKDVPAYRPDW